MNFQVSHSPIIKSLFISFLILFSLVGYSQITINGKIKNYDGKSKVYYNPTLEGVKFMNRGLEILPGLNGNFRIKFENKGFGTTTVYFNGVSYSFFHDEKSTIAFTIDQAKIQTPKWTAENSAMFDHIKNEAKIASIISIEGDFAEVNWYYNRMVRSSTITFLVGGCDYSKVVRKATTPNKVISILDSLTQIEMSQINTLYAKMNDENSATPVITPEVKKFLENQVHSFYGSVFLNGMMLKSFDQKVKLMQDPNAPLDIYNKDWERLTELFFSQTAKNIDPAPSTSEYNEFILSMEYTRDEYKDYDFKPQFMTDDELVIERLLHPKLDWMDSLSLLNNDAIFAYKLHNLARFLTTQTFYSPVLLHAVNEMKAQYPNSERIKYFEPQIEKLKAYLKSNAEKYDQAKVIQTNYVSITDLLETFRGKIVLIDIWATWCGPCVEDFNYKSALKPFIQEGKLTVLYISIDKQIWEKKWRENIRFNQLEGYHVLADDVLIRDVWKYLGGEEGVIPRYALIDKNGNSFLTQAARPSEDKKLVQQVEVLLAKE